jgi:hypothetical protein
MEQAPVSHIPIIIQQIGQYITGNGDLGRIGGGYRVAIGALSYSRSHPPSRQYSAVRFSDSDKAAQPDTDSQQKPWQKIVPAQLPCKQ